MFTTSDLSLNQYHHVFFQVARDTSNVITTYMYDNALNALGTLDTSFGSHPILNVFQVLDASGSNPLVIGKGSSYQYNLDVAHFSVYNRTLTTTQQALLMNYTNETFLEPHTESTLYMVSASGGKFYIDNVEAPVLDVSHGIYVFDQRDSTNGTHPLRLSTVSDGTHNGGTEYTRGVVTNGTPGSINAYTLIQIDNLTPPILYYYCSNHGGMGSMLSLVDYTYFVKVVQNAIGDSVYAFSEDGVTYYNQPPLSFVAPYIYQFNLVGSMANYDLAFGTEVDNANTVIDSYYITSMNATQFVLDLRNHNGNALYYFDASFNNMGYYTYPSVGSIDEGTITVTDPLDGVINANPYTVSGYHNIFADGIYDLSASSYVETTNVFYKVLDVSGTGFDWLTTGNLYDSDGKYTGATSTMVGNVEYKGEWIQLRLPYHLVLSDLITNNDATDLDSSPKTVHLLGSNDNGSTFDYLSEAALGKTTATTTTFSSVYQRYSTFRMIVEDTHGGSNVHLGFWSLEGTAVREYPENSVAHTMTVSGSPEVYYVDNIPQDEIDFSINVVYLFDQSDTTNANYQVFFSGIADGPTNTGYMEIVGSPGHTGAYTKLQLDATYPGQWFYYSTTRDYMGYGPMELGPDSFNKVVGDVVTFTVINRTGVVEPYSITGVTSADIGGADLSGIIEYGRKYDLSYSLVTANKTMVFAVGDVSSSLVIGDYKYYEVAVQTNVVGKPVFAFYDTTDAVWYNQPELSFHKQQVYEFDLSNSVTDNSYVLVFGTEVDNSGTVVSSSTFVDRSQNNKVILNLRDYIGESLVYFEDSSAGMGYVEMPIVDVSYGVTVSGSPEVFYLDGSANPSLDFSANTSYVFDQSDSTNAGQQIVFGYAPDKTANILTAADGVTIMGTPGQPGAYTQLDLSSGFVGPLYYYSDGSANMGMDWLVDQMYSVKVQQNVIGQYVYAFDLCGNGDWYNQPDLSFTSPYSYGFDVSDPSNNGYVLSFGTTVDVSDASIESSYVTRTNAPGTTDAKVILNLRNYSGANLVYFDQDVSGMGYIGYTAVTEVNTMDTIFSNVTLPSFYWDFRTTTPETNGSDTYLSDIMDNQLMGSNVRAVSNGLSFNDSTDGPYFTSSSNLIVDDITFGGECSYEAYFKTGNSVSDWARVIAFQRSGFILAAKYPDNNYIGGLFNNNNSSNYGHYYATGATTTTDTWYHVIVTVTSGGVLKIYKNATSYSAHADSAFPSQTFTNGTYKNYFGMDNYGGSQSLNGNIRYIRFWQDHILSQTEVTNLFGTKDTNYEEYQFSAELYTVTVSGDPGVFDLSGTPQLQINFSANESYLFDQSDSTNAGQQIVFGYTPDDTANILTSADGVTVMGTPGRPGAYTQLDLSAGFIGPLYYYSDGSANMGWQLVADISYQFTVKMNIYDEPVWAVYDTTNTVWYNQPDLSFSAPYVYEFDVSDPSNNGYVLSFGTIVDVSDAAIDISYVTRTNPPGTTDAKVLLDLRDYSGANLVYFEDSSAGMGYVTVPPTTEIQVNLLSDWAQLGSDLDGEATGDLFGFAVSLSSDGKTVAVSGPRNDGTGTRSGHVRVFTYNDVSSSWVQKGLDIDGEAAGDLYGLDVGLSSDGNTVAIGAPQNDGNGGASGHARVYRYNGSAWSQIGSDIDGVAGNDQLYSVSLSSDGNTLAIGALGNDDNGTNSGHVRVFEYSNNTWTQKGLNIQGEAANDYSGRQIKISSDGSRVAIGAPENDGGGSNSGHVRVFEYSNNTWTQIGSDIDGKSGGDQVGFIKRLALSSDGNTVVLSSAYNNSNTGYVQVYTYTNNAWTQKGSDILGSANNDYFGSSVSVSSDGNVIAIGNSYNGHASYAGFVRVLEYSNNTWTQIASDIQGEANGDNFGDYVNLSSDGYIVAIGAFNNDGNGTDSGHARVYTIKEEVEVESPSYTVTVSGEPMVFYLDGSANPSLDFSANTSYVFDQSDSTNAGQQIVFGYAPDNTTNILTAADGVTIMGTPGQPGAYTQLDLSSGFVGPLYYYSDGSANMGYTVTNYETLFSSVTEPSFYWDFRTTTPLSDATGDYVEDVINGSIKARAVGNLSFNSLSGPTFNDNDYVDIDDFKFGGACSIEVYFNVTQFTSLGRIIDFASSTSGGDNVILRVDSNGITFQLRIGTGSSGQITPNIYSSVSTNTWYHVIATVESSGNVEAYVDGSSSNLNTTFNSSGGGAVDVLRTVNFAGNDTWYQGGQNLNGNLAFVRVWYGHVLTSSEVVSLYNNRELIGID